jgi:N-methylhydantoinase A
MAFGAGIDIGGTFIDAVVSDARGTCILKVPSPTTAPAAGVIPALRQLVAAQGDALPSLGRAAHGTTVATNALLERRWGRTALITTQGFADVLTIGRQNRSRMYDLRFRRPPSIIPRDLRFEARERVAADGSILVPLTEAEIERVLDAIEDEAVEAAAVCFLFSFLHPDHERRIGDAVRRRGGIPLTRSSDLLPEFREYERMSTTAINAALLPVVGRYLEALGTAGREAGIVPPWEIMQSSGAMIPAEVAQRQPARILLSGPAAGVEAARCIGAALRLPDVISLDMGGTSCDVALIAEGRVATTTSGAVGGYAVALPMVDVHTIGAGGGSIAWVDAGGALRVGPRSAGATPGPCCFGRGGEEPTVTDAHVVLGRIPADHPIGGLARLDLEAARHAIGGIARQIGGTIEEVANGVLRVANAAMERAVRQVSVERGHDPRRFALLAFGGAGPLHAVDLARGLEIPTVVLPATAGVLSAAGLLSSDTAFDVSQGILRPLAALDPAELSAVVGRLWEAACTALGGAAKGSTPGHVVDADLRYVGQSHELTVPGRAGRGAPILGTERAAALLDALRASFHRLHAQRFGHADPGRAVELVAVRLRATIPGSGFGDAVFQTPRGADPAPRGRGAARRAVRFLGDAGGPRPTAVVRRAELSAGERVEGPLLIVSAESTAVIPPGCAGRVHDAGHLLLEVRP